MRTSSHDGHPILAFHCALKVIHTMETTRDVRAQRVALYAALVAYLEKLFHEKDRTHYASKRWWRAILIKYPTLGIIISLIAVIYSQWHQNPKYDSTIAIILSVIPLAYFTFIFLGGPMCLAKHTRNAHLPSSAWLVNSLYSGPGRPFGR